jgi:excisionase family DNA binding protein
MRLVTYRELGEELSLSIRYLQKCVQQESLPCIRFGRAVRFDPNAITEWVNKRNQRIAATHGIKNDAITEFTTTIDTQIS